MQILLPCEVSTHDRCFHRRLATEHSHASTRPWNSFGWTLKLDAMAYFEQRFLPVLIFMISTAARVESSAYDPCSVSSTLSQVRFDMGFLGCRFELILEESRSEAQASARKFRAVVSVIERIRLPV